MEGNEVNLEDDLVSRRHSSIRLQDRCVVLRDLGSKNGTFVNGESVSKRVLKHGDVIKIGSSILIYMEHGDEDDVPTFVEGDADRLRSVTTLRVVRDEPLFPNTDPLRACFLDLISQSFPDAVRAAVLLVGRNSADEFVSASYLPSKFAVSHMVTHLALRDGLPILSKDVDSVLCAPLIAKGTRLGVLYADNPRKDAFDQNHLKLMTAIAAAASEALERTRYGEWLEAENQRLNEEIEIEHDMIGASSKMREVYTYIQRVAGAEANVLILGETGTGKELAARAIHRNSLRSERPFLAVNCGAIAESLIQSELFGHEKGSFTGAVSQRKGKIEAADGGTLFLDEVGELPLPLQAGLLRVIQEREFERLGGTRPLKANIRLVAATNRNLEEEVKQGRFRQDLYFRLHVVSIRMPSLSERHEDIPLLIEHFIRKHRRPGGVSGISSEILPLFLSYDWPGNVRELENVIERACLLGKADLIRPEDLPEAMTERKPADAAKSMSYHDGLNAAKRKLIEDALRQTDGNVIEAATMLGLHPTHLYRLMRDLFPKS
jgi:transcriptional regulator with GAF, ATPase, and Fis domain